MFNSPRYICKGSGGLALVVTEEPLLCGAWVSYTSTALPWRVVLCAHTYVHTHTHAHIHTHTHTQTNTSAYSAKPTQQYLQTHTASTNHHPYMKTDNSYRFLKAKKLLASGSCGCAITNTHHHHHYHCHRTTVYIHTNKSAYYPETHKKYA